MIEISRLEETDFYIFKSWIKSEEELFQFAGPILTFPVTDDQLLAYINDSRRVAYKVVLSETSEMIGSAELNFENPMPRLSRILIGDKAYRSKGLGKRVVNKLLEMLFFDHDFQQADLNVFDWNETAINCYKSVGFVINPDLFYKHNHKGRIWNAINMTITRKSWVEKSDKKNAST